MNSLTSAILDNQQRQTKLGIDAGTDELGIPKQDGFGNDITRTPDYMVCRALLRDRKIEPFEEDTVNRLHTRDGLIFRGDEEIEETTENFYRLTGVVDNVKYGLRLNFWQVLKRKIPSLSRAAIKISEDLYWDQKNGEVFHGSYWDFVKKVVEGRNNG